MPSAVLISTSFIVTGTAACADSTAALRARRRPTSRRSRGDGHCSDLPDFRCCGSWGVLSFRKYKSAGDRIHPAQPAARSEPRFDGEGTLVSPYRGSKRDLFKSSLTSIDDRIPRACPKRAASRAACQMKRLTHEDGAAKGLDGRPTTASAGKCSGFPKRTARA